MKFIACLSREHRPKPVFLIPMFEGVCHFTMRSQAAVLSDISNHQKQELSVRVKLNQFKRKE